ncbi:MAG: helix-turn-helix domain-containing protein [Chloroflexi bacterium]|nr:helix-turn-helix domain-containing protein [Chloroflexota bacterium]
MNDSQEHLWTVEDVAAYLQIKAETVRKLSRQGTIPGFQVGRLWRYTPERIRQWIEELQQSRGTTT